MGVISNISAHITDLILYPLKKTSKQISGLYIVVIEGHFNPRSGLGGLGAYGLGAD